MQAYPQAALKSTIFLHSPPGVELSKHKGEVVLKLLKNLYGLKHAVRTWYEHLSEGLDAMGFAPTISDPCILVRRTDIIVLYVDDCIVVSKSKEDTDRIFQEFQTRGFKITDEGTMEEYLGLQIQQNDDFFRISQPLLIDRIIQTAPSMKDARSAKTPAVVGEVLTKDEYGDQRKKYGTTVL